MACFIIKTTNNVTIALDKDRKKRIVLATNLSRSGTIWSGPGYIEKKNKELLRHMASLFKSTVIVTQKKIKGLNTILLTSPIVALVQYG